MRLAAILATALAAASSAHAGVERTVRCVTQTTGGAPSFGIQAWPQTWSKPYWFPADAVVFTGGGTQLVSIHGASPGYLLDGGDCHASATHVPLRAAGLPRVARLVLGDYPTVRVRCTLAGAVLVRFRVQQDGKGLPRVASIALRLARGNRPLAYVTWSWTHVTAWAAPVCETTMPRQP